MATADLLGAKRAFERANLVGYKGADGGTFGPIARQLQAGRAIGAQRALTVATTYLGAHAVPPEHAGDADGYVDRLCSELIPAVAASGQADAFDAYCERVAFTASTEIDRVIRIRTGETDAAAL